MNESMKYPHWSGLALSAKAVTQIRMLRLCNARNTLYP